jgi:hypothetical protein
MALDANPTTPPLQIDKFGLPPGIELADGDNLKEWTFDIRVLDANPLYQNQIYRLKFIFPQSYPIGMRLDNLSSWSLFHAWHRC